MYTALKNLAKDMMLEPERPLFGGQIVQKDYIEYYKYTLNILLGALGSSRSLENLECHVSLIAEPCTTDGVSLSARLRASSQPARIASLDRQRRGARGEAQSSFEELDSRHENEDRLKSKTI